MCGGVGGKGAVQTLERLGFGRRELLFDKREDFFPPEGGKSLLS